MAEISELTPTKGYYHDEKPAMTTVGGTTDPTIVGVPASDMTKTNKSDRDELPGMQGMESLLSPKRSASGLLMAMAEDAAAIEGRGGRSAKPQGRRGRRRRFRHHETVLTMPGGVGRGVATTAPAARESILSRYLRCPLDHKMIHLDVCAVRQTRKRPPVCRQGPCANCLWALEQLGLSPGKPVQQELFP